MIANLQRPLAFGILVLVIVYLTGFVGKGWLPHDEGMIGLILILRILTLAGSRGCPEQIYDIVQRFSICKGFRAL